MSPEQIIAELGLDRHPEGGWYTQTWLDPATDASGRSHGSAIYFLLRAGERSHWHRVDATEVWHHYAGDPIRLCIDTTSVVLGADLAGGQRPQAVVPAGAWQAAEPLGAWTLVGCTVSPAFSFDRFELAPPGYTGPDGAS